MTPNPSLQPTRLKSPKGAQGFTPPYPPSWLDRLMAWIDRFPGPAWAFYLILGAVVVLAETAIQWKEGAYRVGTFNLLTVWSLGDFAYLLGLMHYLDKSAASAIASFRPLLVSPKIGRHPTLQDQAKFGTLAYQLTTLPARPTLIATLAGATFTFVVLILQTTAGILPAPLVGTAGTPLSTAAVMVAFFPANTISILFIYHTVHQLVQISRIYTHHVRIDIYHLQPLYALSQPGAITAIGIILFSYAWIAITSSASIPAGALGIAMTVTFAAIAGATFALPLWGAHRRLVAEKSRLVADASSRFGGAIEELHRQLDGKGRRKGDPIRALAGIEIEQNALRRIPTWPWQPGAVRGLLAALLLPVVVWAIQLLLGRFFGT